MEEDDELMAAAQAIEGHQECERNQSEAEGDGNSGGEHP